ncbi:MAG TPA: AAA family ATPase, partial [Anaerolineae bacterium]|nr:AAA family ATPase [Anaerolineae bacterium]
ALQFPPGYTRRLGLQDTLDRVNKLRSDLEIRFHREATVLLGPLKGVSQMLYQELHGETGVEEGVFRNPYVVGKPIRLNRADLFKGRQELGERLANMLRSRGNPTLILHGPRRMGKTSFLLQLPRLLPGEFVPVFLDMQEGASESEASFTYSLAMAIYKQLRTQFSMRRPEMDDHAAHPFAALNVWLDEMMPDLGSRTLFLTIDEFESLGLAIARGPLTERVLDYLRHLMQHYDNLSLLFAGVQTIEALGPRPDSYFISAYPIEISYLHPKEAEALIRTPDPSAGKMPKYDDGVVRHLLDLTRCQPCLIQAICFEIIELAGRNGLAEIHQDTLDEAVTQVLRMTGHFYFENIWKDAGEEGRKVLCQLAGGPQQLDEQEIGETVMHGLLRRHVIHKRDDRTYEIEIPLVQQWMAQRSP